MKNRDIYISALHLIGEDVYEEQNDDYEERASFLLAAFCSETEATDAAYREYKKLGAAEKFSCVFLSLDADFPCCDRFANSAAFYLAAMLTIDNDTELSDKLFDRYCDSMAKIQSSIPSKIEKIAQKYL